ncbi:Thermophilic serine proteinase [Burkholderiales bacterium]|nr:Thermophilic serine proteinase [Burkholderiales bacterium]
MRPTRKRSSSKTSAFAGRSRRPLRAALLAAPLVLLGAATARPALADATCEAFSLSAATAAADAAAGAEALDAPGVQPSTPPRLDPALEAREAIDGEIIRIPEGQRPSSSSRVGGEAILVLPKLPSGELADQFKLGRDAEIVESFWSPVLCATLVRIRGPRDAKPADLVPEVTPPAVVLPHSRYRTSASSIRPAPEVATKQGVDPYRPLQIGLAQLGVMPARGRSDGRGAKLALLDSAPDLSHRELSAVRLVPVGKGPPPSPALHGTLMAGVVAATENNAFGITGVAPGAEVIAIPVCSPVGDGTSDECDLFDILQGMDAAWQENASIVNLSLAGPPDPLLQRAVARLVELDLVIVAAAGNAASSKPTYPAAYPGVVGVGAVDAMGEPFEQGNHGPWVAIAGPGVEILSTTPNDSFAFVSGTSLAAAQLSGVLALLSSVVPDPPRMRLALLATARGSLVSASAATDAPTTARAPLAPTVCSVLADLGQSCNPSGSNP